MVYLYYRTNHTRAHDNFPQPTSLSIVTTENKHFFTCSHSFSKFSIEVLEPDIETILMSYFNKWWKVYTKGYTMLETERVELISRNNKFHWNEFLNLGFNLFYHLLCKVVFLISPENLDSASSTYLQLCIFSEYKKDVEKFATNYYFHNLWINWEKQRILKNY